MDDTFEPNPGLQATVEAAGGARHPVAAGRLSGTTGTPVAHATVRLDLEPAHQIGADVASGVGVALVRLAQTTTDDQGRFGLDAPDLGNLDGYLNDDGTVSVLVTSTGPGGNLLYHLSAYPPSDAGTGWRWADPDTATVQSPAASADTGGLTGLSLRTTGGDPSAATGGEVSPAGVAGGDYCPGVTYYWDRYDGAIIKNWDRVQRVKTRGRTTWTYDWSTTKTTTVDAAANLGSGGALVRAGYVHVQANSAGVDFRFGNWVNQDARVQFDNRPYYLYCHDVPSGKTWYSGVYEWRPYKFTGGNDHAAPKHSIFSCNTTYRIRIGDPLWVARSTSYAYGAGATLSTITVRVKQQNDDYHKLRFAPSLSPAYLCGSNDYPVYARQVKEVAVP